MNAFNKNFLLTIVFLLSICCYGNQNMVTEQWGVFELSLQGPASGNPYLEVTLEAEFCNDSHKLTVPGFYDGDGTYRIRFSPDRLGSWKYVTRSNRAELSGRTGSLECTKPTGNNHGPVQVVNTHYLEYADGSPVYIIGTTAYQWTSVKQSIQEQTIKTLAKSPFNKVRMCVFPKSFHFGNNTEPWQYAYENVNDASKPIYEFFQNFDKRVRQLLEMGIEADVIIFHPYDKWGYSKMGKENNERYVRYLIARLSAYRNVWWSLANEWDVGRIKNNIDWEGIGTLLQKEDPHQRLRGIHNWYYSESHFYDHSRPWITHVSGQSIFFFRAIKWRNQYNKPLLYDEMRYEGDVSHDWGNLSPQKMVENFWKAALSGVYGTHGDTYKNDSDDQTEVRWWAKGGTLMGQSPERIAFLKKIMEDAPVTEMTPQLVMLSPRSIPESIPDQGQGVYEMIAELNNSIYIFAKEKEYYLAYTAEADRTIELNLAGKKDYKLQVIDTWNMKVVSEKVIGSGSFQHQTDRPFTALRLIVVP